jgi:apolipoprotein N-acyltransferase
MRRLRPFLLPTLAGVLYFLSWIGFGVWPLAFVCFVPLLFALDGVTPRRALWLGWWMGFVTHLGGYTWILHLLRVFADAPLPLAFLGYLLLCAAQGLLFGVMSCAMVWLRRRTKWQYVALLPIALSASEFCFPMLFQSYTGVALMPVLPMAQIADLGGPILLSALQALINGALFDAVLAFKDGSRTPFASMAVSLASVLASGGYGFHRINQVDERQQKAPHLRVGLAQPNVGEIELHADPEASVKALRDATAELSVRGAQLVIWPEAGYTHAIRDGAQDGSALLAGIPVNLIAGAIRVSRKDIWNSAIAVDDKGKLGDHYDKIALLAFGEYIPFGDWFPQLYQWSPMASHLSRGTTTAPLHVAGYRFATFICYEDILPEMVRSTMADHGDGRAQAMVNLTNDSWYGAGHEQEEHLMLAAVRSIEHRRWLLRATSTGISAFVDATGRVVQRIDRNQRGVAVRDVPMMEGSTVFETLGMWPGWAALGCFAFGFFRGRGTPSPVTPPGQSRRV